MVIVHSPLFVAAQLLIAGQPLLADLSLQVLEVTLQLGVHGERNVEEGVRERVVHRVAEVVAHDQAFLFGGKGKESRKGFSGALVEA